MKHFYSYNLGLFLVMLLFVALTPDSMCAQTVTIDGIRYSLYSNMSVHQATVEKSSTYSSNYSGNVVIPSTITYNDYVYNVIAIGTGAFQNCNNLTSVTIPSTVSKIGGDAFYGCNSLTSLQLPSSVSEIGGSAFRGCTGITSFVIPNGVENIPNYAFYGCSHLTEISIPTSVATIGQYAFQNTALSSIDIPVSVTEIGTYAFSGTALQTIEVPSSITKIANYSFQNCKSLESVVIPNSVTSIGNYAFSGCSVLTKISIPNSVTSIGTSAFERNIIIDLTIDSYSVMDYFSGSTTLKSVTIGNNVTKIKSKSFQSCNALETILIPTTVTSIEYNAFQRCVALKTIDLPSSLLSIDMNAFDGCTGLTNIVIPDNVKTIGSSSFYGCTGLTSMSIPASVETIGSQAFRGCTGLTSLILNEGLKSIGNGAFRGCTGLTTVVIPSTVETIYSEAFLGCTALADVVLPPAISSIGVDAFTNTAWMNGQPDGVIYIDNMVYGFKGIMPANTTLDFKEGTTTILSSAFAGCTGLAELTIPSTIKTIGASAFYGCTNLKVVKVDDLASWCNIDFANSDANPIKFAQSLRLSGENVTSLNISDGITEIKNYAFTGFLTLTSVTLPVSINKIGISAFEGCSQLSTIQGMISTSITEIGGRAFANTKLTSIDIPATITSIGANAFYSLSLTKINIADVEAWCKMYNYSSLPTTAYQLYLNGTLIKELLIPSTITDVPSNKFAYVSNIETVSFPDELKTINSSAFQNCTSLTSVDIPSSVSYIGKQAFSGCTNVSLVTIHENQYGTQIESNAFYGIKKVLFKSEVPSKISNDGIFNKSEGILYIPDNAFDTYLQTGQYAKRFQSYCCISYKPDMIGAEIDNRETTATSINIYYHYISLNSNTPISEALANQTGTYKKGGLTPNTTYNQSLLWTLPSGIQVWYPFSTSVRTNALTLTALDPEAKSNTKARISASTNGDDDSQRFGFEWRRNDAPDTTPWNIVICPISKGVMAGTLSGLSASTYYDFRPFYKPDEGNVVYGEKKTFITADAYVEFQPEVYTYEASSLADNSAIIKGYILSGSETIIEQGFEYWPVSASLAPISNRSPSQAVKVTGEGDLMVVTLTGLSSGTEYAYRTYVKTASATTYGDQMYFRTTGIPSSSSSDVWNLETDNVERTISNGNVYSLTGRLVATDVLNVKSLPKGIYILNGKKIVVK